MPEHEDLAHQNLIKDTLGIDLAESGYYPEAESGPNEPESNDFHDILSKLAKSNTHKIKNSKKLKKTFDAKDDTPATQRKERAAEYDDTISKHLNKWEQIARKEERKQTVIFPLTSNDSKIKKYEKTQLRSESYNFTPKSELELKLDELYKKSEKVTQINVNTGLTELEKKLISELSNKEAKDRIASLRHQRFLISSQEAKNKRIKKIKSKNFRKRQRKLKEKEEEKLNNLAEQEAVESGNIEKLEILQNEKERLRALERASLRHKHTSTKVKEAKRYAKFNDAEKQQIADREMLHKELITQGKQAQQMFVEEESEEEYIPGEKEEEKEKLKEKIVSADQQALDEVKKMFNEGGDGWLDDSKDDVNLAAEIEEAAGKIVDEPEDDEEEEDDSDDEDAVVESEKNKPNKEQEEEARLTNLLASRNSGKEKDLISQLNKLKDVLNAVEVEAVETEKEKEMQEVERKSKILLQQENFNHLSEQLKDQDSNNLISLQEAFADDDIANEFNQEKEDMIDELAELSNTKSNALPGWDSWSGPVPIKKLSRRQLRKKRAKERRELQNKKDDLVKKRKTTLGELDHVVVNQEALKSQLEGLRPDSVPFPFTSKEQYEKSLRMPLGTMFNTFEGSKKLCQPEVITKMGQIIKPLSNDDAFFEDPNEKKKAGAGSSHSKKIQQKVF